ncbi:MAG: DUF512 domain-containing protein [Acidimicrobiaceae bacterium]|nr:DUF512 domain-containing protein [Acidimicrobiaceae bacterium]MXW61687.1 DUF512 domain-containing protein [Acidimicrobiaceae bacterium]MXW77149.1 DUF512 domain-containing protein [Acidimicrobiaceae bacterium]MYC42731.1 DUF512 domain-containing protein [Acidimicrobiaceae bacterium]MYD06377.1 DUF512 domain-containing protein [Acidimicrobiaceae bacterium]
MSSPRVVALEPESPAEQAGLMVGDEILKIDGEAPRDVIRWQILTDDAVVPLSVQRESQRVDLVVTKRPGEPLGAEVHAAVFDRVQTCDNHCEFCFIHQLPRGMRRSLYLKDDDYRLSFLYGNFTTLTRFSELDMERVITERLSPLNVSIHATDPQIRADILGNRRGAVSLRWLRVLLDHGIEVHGQVVVCPGVNDGDVLEDTLAGVLERFSELATICVVPLGVSRFNKQKRMRPHTITEAQRVVDIVSDWQEIFLGVLGRRLVFAADEYYLMADRPFPDADSYEGFPMHEDGIGMARTLESEFQNPTTEPTRPRSGFFAWVDGAPADGYRSPRSGSPATSVGAPEDTGSGESDVSMARATRVSLGAARHAPVGVLTGTMSAPVIESLTNSLGRTDVRVIAVPNNYFGGNIGVTGLMVGEDLERVLSGEPEGHRYLLPDVCLSRGVFLDGTSPQDLPRTVEVVPTDGAALRHALTLGGRTEAVRA